MNRFVHMLGFPLMRNIGTKQGGVSCYRASGFPTVPNNVLESMKLVYFRAQQRRLASFSREEDLPTIAQFSYHIEPRLLR